MPELVIFDLDNTLIKEQSQAALLGYAFKKRLIGPFFYFAVTLWFVFYKLGLVKNPRKIMEYSFGFLRNKSIEYFRNIIDDFFEKRLHSRIFKEIPELVRDHKSKGRKTLIISNAINYIPEKVALFLGIDYFIGTKLEITNNKFTGKIDGDIIYGKNKVVAINDFIKKNRFSLGGSWGYSDHYSDIPFLEMVDYPVSVNPDKKLLERAKKENWPVLIFKETITKNGF